MLNKNIMSGTVDSIGTQTGILPGQPLIEIYRNRRVLIENHKGILCYSRQQIQVRMAYGSVCICGDDMYLKRMCKEQLVVSGCIRSVALLEG